MIMTHWHVGMKVICVRDLSHCGTQMEMVPQVGHIYTIRDLEYGRHVDDRVCFRLQEIVNEACKYRSGYFECSFGCDNFRPVIETQMKETRVLRSPVPELLDA
jgi:hypothetical protein